jgi:outer membrane protein, heavy metal efflux system
MRRRALVLVLSIAAAACVPPRSEVWGPVEAQVERRLGVTPAWTADERTTEAARALLAEPLTLDGAIRIALATNRHLQAAFADLGVAAGDVASATVLPPTDVDLDVKFALGDDEGHGDPVVEVSAVQDVLALIQIGQRRGVARDRLAAARSRAVADTLQLALDVERAYWDVVTAQQVLELRQTAFDAASASAELAERMRAAGNTTELALARERDQREETRLALGRAQTAVEVARTALDGALGLTGDETTWTITARLPDLGAAPALDTIEVDAVDASLELAALRSELSAAGGEVGEARLRSWLPTFGVGVAVERGGDGSWEAGPAVRLGLPIFDQGQGARARAWAGVRRAKNELAATAIDLRSTARAVRLRVLGAHAEARHLRDVVLPLRQQIVDETLRQYNAMNASTFELLAARRSLADAGREYLEALRRYAGATAEATALQRGLSPAAHAEDDGAATDATSTGARSTDADH